MSLFRNMHQQNKAKLYLTVTCLILFFLISVQSAFAVTDNHKATSNNKKTVAHHQDSFAVASITQLQTGKTEPAKKLGKESAKKQQLAHEACVDFDCECCSCGSNVMFTLVSVNDEVKTPEQLNFIFKSLQLSPPYYALLRPPKRANL